MKKITIIFVCLALASCTKDVKIPSGGDVPVGFTPITDNITTKAVCYGAQNGTYTLKNSGNYEKFTAYAKYTGTLADNPQISGTDFFPEEGVECSHFGSGASDYWAPTTAKYWPVGGYLTFHALSPSSLSPYSGNVSHSWSSGITITEFTAGTNRNQQVDLMYSDFEFKKKRSDYSPETGMPYDEASEAAGYSHKGVNLTFHHALTSVQFKFKTEDDFTESNVKYYFRIRRIQLLNVNYKGEFYENRTSACDNSYGNAPAGSVTFNDDNSLTATPYWVPASNVTPYIVSDLKASTLITNNLQQVGSTMLLMPQHLSHGSNVSVKIYYYFSYKVGSDEEKSYPVANPNQNNLETDYFNLTIPLNGLPGTIGGTPTTVNQWLINHKYTYTITFHLDPLLFDPKVDVDYVDVTPISIDLPYQE